MNIIICVCTYNRNHLLDRLLKHLRDNCLKEMPDIIWEILIVDNNPSRQATPLCSNYSETLPIQYVHQPKKGLVPARNKAVSQALKIGADFIAFIDDDDLPKPNWLTELLASQQENQADIVVGSRAKMKVWDSRQPTADSRQPTILLNLAGCVSPRMRPLPTY